MQHEEIRSLEDLVQFVIKAENMAIYTYEKIIEKVKDTKVRQRLISFQTEHKQWIDSWKHIWSFEAADTDLSLMSQTAVTGMLVFDQLRNHQDADYVVRVRDEEEKQIKELKTLAQTVSFATLQAGASAEEALERMIAQSARRVRELNRHVDQLRDQEEKNV
ncbi:hypothetical protein LSG31_22145 [Fodinisporobacter ferrooxydans]|uniref:DUF2383 domain-containing protein n=1 Tax=Fodinisporobacter ferrooxydans TaxID=2901836 RepID=A0ABY4CJ30_9BACL|nr:hypothetical protein LSG31_22145 [Alicyclobacillaceae bacterium MYW30-H2]